MGRYIGLAKESNYGEGVAPTVFMRVLSESIQYNPNYIYHRTIEGGRKLQTAQSAKKQSVGSIKFIPVYDHGLGEILHMLLGKVTSSEEEAGVRYKHVFEPAESLNDLASYTIEKGLDDITGERYAGCCVSKLKLTAKPADFLVIDADTFGKKPELVQLATPSFSNQDYITSGHTSIQTLNGLNVAFEEFSIEIQGGIVPRFTSSSDEIHGLDLEPINVTASFTSRFRNIQDLQEFLDGIEKSFVCKWQGPALGNANYSLTIELPRLNFDEGDIAINEQERLMQVRNVTALDSPSGLIKVTLENGKMNY
ncbi:MAG: hypothetical protein KatS3mg003_0982 [Candidatus Nitrosocaldaceae archaeon]|nr:MAG: hypothetical protein KatS3mg003_0982 [Candidatus Nitrosocaldaceae archaeon]